MSYTIEDNDEWFRDIYKRVSMLTIEEITANDREIFYKLCKEFIERIIGMKEPMSIGEETSLSEKKFNFTNNICSYAIIELFIPFVRRVLFEHFNVKYSDGKYDHIIDDIKEQHERKDGTVFLGAELKRYGFANLTQFPEKSQELLDSCEDEVEYCMMNPYYFISDYLRVNYVCASASPDLIKVTRFTKYIPFGEYKYCIIPDGTLCLFRMAHHSAGACGQPVICAGFITIKNNKIKKIDNDSGHYAPPLKMLKKAISLLKKQKLIVSTGELDEDKSSDDIKVYNFKTHTYSERMKRSLKRLFTRSSSSIFSGAGGKYTRRMRKKRI
jgi:hypothetical protein